MNSIGDVYFEVVTPRSFEGFAADNTVILL